MNELTKDCQKMFGGLNESNEELNNYSKIIELRTDNGKKMVTTEGEQQESRSIIDKYHCDV